MTLERNDIGASGERPVDRRDAPARRPYGQARDDYAIFTELAERLGVGEAFTEGRTETAGCGIFTRSTRAALLQQGHEAPDFDAFWAAGELTLPTLPWDRGMVRAFRARSRGRAAANPDRQGRDRLRHHRRLWLRRLPGPSRPGCLRPRVSAARSCTTFPLQLVANQPATPPAQPARFRRGQPGLQGPRA